MGNRRPRICRCLGIAHPAPGALVLAAALMLLAGCGSKISEANYYRVHYGMDEGEVDDVLGPAHQESLEAQLAEPPPLAASRPPGPATATAPATRAGVRKIKTWMRDDLTISVHF